MMIDQIGGNPSTVPSARTSNEKESYSFNKVLSEKTLALSKGGQALDTGGATASKGNAQDLPTSEPVKIGTITSKNPTVSDLLVQDPNLKKDCWNIVYARQNRDKAYTCIPNGTDIYYDPASRELLWGDMMDKYAGQSAMASTSSGTGTDQSRSGFSPAASENGAAAAAASEAGVDRLNASLVDAVQPLIGKRYSDVNCYELLVSGLSKMGIRYYGSNGLGHQMISGARDRGLPMNAYLNGEGLIRFSGSQTYRKALVKVSDPARQAREVIDEIAAHLEKGSILSFSTESRGHTGIVSNKDGAWTYINSGVMDNPVDAKAASKGVGEERLDKEIENWFRLAARKNESLVITLGKLNQNKLAAYEDGKGQRA